jgi:hypothetical protein
MDKIYALRNPKTNVQVMQQNVLLKHKYLVTFMRKNAPEVLTEVRVAYVETMSRVLRQAMAGYVASSGALRRDVAGRSDLLGANASAISPGRDNVSGSSVFELGTRGDVLRELETTPPIIVHHVEASGAKYPREALFRSSHKLLMDTATFEYLFCAEFWGGSGGGAGAANDVFADIFAGPIVVMEDHLRESTAGLGVGPGAPGAGFGGDVDVVGVALMLRVNTEHQHIMTRRRVPCLDKYLDGVNMTLWPKFKNAHDAHVRSVIDAAAAAARSNAFSADDASVAAHHVARRYADLTRAMTSISSGAGEVVETQIESAMERLRTAVIDFLTRASARFRRRSRGVAFLVNNFERVRAAIAETSPIASVTGGAVADPMESAAYGYFTAELARLSGEYVEETLRERFGGMISFVERAEAAAGAAAGAGESAAGDAELTPAAAAPLMRDFAERWKRAIEEISAEVSASFPGTETTGGGGGGGVGGELLKSTLSRLLVWYNRLSGPEGVLARMGPEGAALCADAVANPAFIYEIKRQSRGGGA